MYILGILHSLLIHLTIGSKPYSYSWINNIFKETFWPFSAQSQSHFLNPCPLDTIQWLSSLAVLSCLEPSRGLETNWLKNQWFKIKWLITSLLVSVCTSSEKRKPRTAAAICRNRMTIKIPKNWKHHKNTICQICRIRNSEKKTLNARLIWKHWHQCLWIKNK